MKTRDAFPLALAFAVLCAAWQAACGGGSGGSSQPPPPPAPAIAGLPTSTDALVGKTITLPFTVTNNPTSVTCSVSPGSCAVASNDASVSYTGAAPSSGGAWTATLTLMATNAGGSGTASTTINLGEITGVTVSPALVPLAMNMTQVFTASVAGNGTFPTTVTWTVPTGMGSIVAGTSGASENATYTPPQGVQGFVGVTVTATAADGTTLGTAAANVGFASVAYFAPSGQNDQTAGAGALSADHTKAVVADMRTLPGSTETAAGLLLCDLQAGSCSDAWNDSPLSSQIYCMAVGADGAIYATGYEGDGTLRQAVLFKITINGNALQVNRLIPGFQIATGMGTRGQIVELDQDNNVYLAIYAYCPPASSPANCVDVGGWVFEFDPNGNEESNFPVAAAFPVSPTGMDVEPQYIIVTADILTTSWNLAGAGLALYTHDGQLQSYETQAGSIVYHARVFMNGAGDQALSGGQVQASATDFRFSLSSTPITNNLIDPYSPWFFAVWNGDNSGTMSINLAQNAVPNPQGGGTVMGSLSAMGSTDPNGPTDAGAIAWSGEPTPGSPTPYYWKQRFDTAHAPGGAMYSWNGAAYYTDSQNLSHLVFFGNGSTACGTTACAAVVVADWIPPSAQ